jgi:hypothetical protein
MPSLFVTKSPYVARQKGLSNLWSNCAAQFNLGFSLIVEIQLFALI